MWIAFAILTTAALSMSAVLALHKWENRRFVRATIGKGLSRSSPLRAMLIVPCRGTDVDLEVNLRALFKQRGVEYRLRFVVEDLGDAAALPIVDLQREFPEVPSELICSGRAVESGQKVHNLIAATGDLPDDVEALAFADSDTCPHPYWLAALLTRLTEPQIGARTGYRWLIPQRLTWPNLLLHSLNSSVASLFSRHRYNTVWGGAWAIRRDVFERTGIREAWFGTLNDDLVATRVLRGTPLHIEFEPLCMTASPVDMTPAQMSNFLRRQFMQVRRYVPGYWWLALLASSLFQAAMWTSAALTVAGLCQGGNVQSIVWWWPAGVWLALYGLAVFRGWLGQSAFRSLQAGYESQLALPRYCDIWLGPLIGFFGWLAVVESAIGSSITWRGIRYWISPGGRILHLGRTLDEGYLEALRQSARGQPQRAIRLHQPEEQSERQPQDRRKAA